MKSNIKLLAFAIGILGLVFTILWQIPRAEAYQKTITDQQSVTGGSAPLAQMWIEDNLFSEDGYLDYIELKLRKGFGSDVTGVYVQLELWNWCGSHGEGYMNSTNEVTVNNMSGAKTYRFDFLSIRRVFNDCVGIRRVMVGSLSGTVYAFYSDTNPIPDSCSIFSGVAGGMCEEDNDPAIKIVQETSDEGDPKIYWQQPNFRNGFTSPDFEQWWLCVDIPDSVAADAYYIKVFYGETEDLPVYAMLDDTSQSFGTFPRYYGATYNICHLIDKTYDLEPEYWSAAAELYDQNDNLIAETGRIDFTIVAGPKVQVPAGLPVTSDIDRYKMCQRFSVTWFTIMGVKVPNPIYEGCYLIALLFVFDNNLLIAEQEATKDLFFEQVPFAYFFVVRSNIEQISTIAEPANTEISLDLPIFSDPVIIDVDFFNNELIDTYVNSPIKTWIANGLWIFFATFLLFRPLRFFRPV